MSGRSFSVQVKAGDKNGDYADGQQPLIVDPCGSKETRKFHKGFVRWVCKSCRPPTMGENDKNLRIWVGDLTYGRYKPPCADTTMKIMTEYSAEVDVCKEKKVGLYLKQKILPSVAADIWGENGKSLYALLLYYIDENFEMVEIMLDCVPFSGDRHTALNIETCAKKCLSEIGIGEFNLDADPPVDTVGKECFGSTVDEASSMTKAFVGFEGAPCVCHKIQNALKTAAKTDFMEQLDSNLRGMCSHFRRSDKVKSRQAC